MSGLAMPFAGSRPLSQDFAAVGANTAEPNGYRENHGGVPWRVTKTNLGIDFTGDTQVLRTDIHPGTDWAMPAGTDLFAVNAGRIVAAGTYPDTGEHMLMLRFHVDSTWQTIAFYTHLYKILVPVGGRVTRGQHIAESGNSGWSTGPHLHIEIRRGPTGKDPARSYWSGPEGYLWRRHNIRRLITGGDMAYVPWIVANQ